jgi:tight adherence protein C
MEGSLLALAVVLAFLATGLGVTVLLGMALPAPNPHTARLRALDRGRVAEPARAGGRRLASGPMRALQRSLGRIGRLVIFDDLPFRSTWGKRLVQAGYRSPSAPAVFQGARIALALLLPATFVFVAPRYAPDLTETRLFAAAVALAAAGLALPHWWVGQGVKRRQEEITDAMPNALDLMVICVEAGLGLDATFHRLATERQFSQNALSEEFQLVVQETRAGRPRAEALLALKNRVGLAEVSSLVLTLVQAEKMGTGIGRSLRVYADSFRTQRRQRAEERAAKIPVKMVFPLVLLIFPATLLVLLGPSYILIYKALMGLRR